MTKVELYAIGKSTTLESNKSHVFHGQVVTLTFTVPDYDRAKVYGREPDGRPASPK
jgi:hypothetical protein